MRVVGLGGDASRTRFGEWPHMCAVLERRNGSAWAFVAGASLVADGVLLTAAHKIE